MRSNPHRFLHDAFEKALEQANSPANVMAELIAARFEAAGVRPKKADRIDLERVCERIAAGEPPEILLSLSIARRLSKTVDLNIKDHEVQAVLDRREHAGAETARDIVAQHAQRNYQKFRTWAAKASAIHDRQVASFYMRCGREWKIPFRELSAYLFACTQFGEDFMQELRITDGDGAKLSPRLSSLFLLHARACLVAREIEALLHTGFADGALARWRTLHEIAVIASFISRQDQEVAKRYLAHEAIESAKAATLYQQHVQRLGHKPFTAAQLKAIAERAAALKVEYGLAFGKDYGWAEPAFAGHAPDIAQIEKSVGLDHLRPYYKLASQQTHASMKGALFRMGLGDLLKHGEDLFLVGPTNAGFTDPAQLTALSMLQVLISLLSEDSVLDRLVLIEVLTRMHDRIPAAFVKVEERIKAKELRMRGGIRRSIVDP